MKSVIVIKSKGYFSIEESLDNNYHGVDIEFVSDDEIGQSISRPRILFEYPKNGRLRVLVWADRDSEDYTNEIVFDI